MNLLSSSNVLVSYANLIRSGRITRDAARSRKKCGRLRQRTRGGDESRNHRCCVARGEDARLAHSGCGQIRYRPDSYPGRARDLAVRTAARSYITETKVSNP